MLNKFLAATADANILFGAFSKAKSLYDEAEQRRKDSVEALHQVINNTALEFQSAEGKGYIEFAARVTTTADLEFEVYVLKGKNDNHRTHFGRARLVVKTAQLKVTLAREPFDVVDITNALHAVGKFVDEQILGGDEEE